MKKIFKTVKFKFFISATALIAATTLLCVGLNSALGQKYYFYQIKKMLLSSYSKICMLYDDAALADGQRATEIEKISANNNIHVMIFDGKTPVYSSLPRDSARFSNGENAGGEKAGAEKPKSSETPDLPENSEENQNPHSGGARPPFFKNREIMEEAENYKIFSSYIDSLDAYNIELMGDYKDNMRIIIQSSAAAISETTRVFNRFFILTGLFALLVAGFFAYFISRRITDPIYELSAIAKSMAEMDFSKKYEKTSDDELGHLGKSINTLSQKLETAIGELKSANLQLLEDIKQKEKIDRQRKEFLSNVSHELKTPISIIEAYADGLLEMELDEKSRKYYCEVIVDETEKMSVLIKKLMTLMQLESGKSPAEPEKYDICEQICAIIEVKAPIIRQYSAKVRFEHKAGEKIYINADSFLMEEALTNYLINALKYSSGEKEVVFSLEDLGKEIRINVFNSGSRIEGDDIENIWDSFYMADKARTRDGGSSGLGLSIVKAIASAHNSICGAYNAEGGVVFYIDADKAV